MRLVELEPRWLHLDGRRVGFIFRSPTKQSEFQTCFVAPTPRRQQDAAIEAMLGQDYNEIVQQCNEEHAWAIAGGIDAADFNTISVTPSLDGSAGGLWHGHITAGEIK